MRFRPTADLARREASLPWLPPWMLLRCFGLRQTSQRLRKLGYRSPPCSSTTITWRTFVGERNHATATAEMTLHIPAHTRCRVYASGFWYCGHGREGLLPYNNGVPRGTWFVGHGKWDMKLGVHISRELGSRFNVEKRCTVTTFTCYATFDFQRVLQMYSISVHQTQVCFFGGWSISASHNPILRQGETWHRSLLTRCLPSTP